jgi:undecaprenyl diphosphate synthase
MGCYPTPKLRIVVNTKTCIIVTVLTMSLLPSSSSPTPMPLTGTPLAGVQAAVAQAIQAGTICHVALIMDGNRRWARKRLMPTLVGHHQGVVALERVIEAACNVALPVLTVYAFSTENWHRPLEEVNGLMDLFVLALRQQLPNLLARGVQVHFIGHVAGLPPKVQQVLAEVTQKTAPGNHMRLQVAANYGSRQELTQAVQHIAQAVQAGTIDPADITEATLAQHLYTAHVPDPDVLIRTGGESRLSNYLLWQAAYTELHMTPTLWPDFNGDELYTIMDAVCQRNRRYGK